ncbi:MAG TPA: helix-turn-helix domain-containing protein [Permianibacter sp.]|nr:helix-turn-helix domain-containing protein [Permianibacter sp.]
MRDVYFLMLPGVLLLDMVAPWQAFRTANTLAGAQFRLHQIGPESSLDVGEGVHLAQIAPLPAALPEQAVLVIPGLHISGAKTDPLTTPACRQALQWLRQTLLLTPLLTPQQPSLQTPQQPPQPRHQLVAVCAGALVAAQAGLLAHRRCTTHHDLCQRLAQIEPTAQVCDDRIFVQDGNVHTSAGVTSGMDLALYLIGEWCGQDTAIAVARDLVVYLRRSGDDPQLSPWLSWRNHMQSKIHRVQDQICRHPEKRWSLEELAAAAHLSVRHLTRVFRDTTGISLHEYQQRIRLDHARRLLQDSGHSVERIAELTGYGSARSLRRAWRSAHADAPSAQRRASR